MDGGLEGDRLCPAKMPVRPTMVIELKTAARRRCRRRRRPTRSRAGRITVKNSGADDPTAIGCAGDVDAREAARLVRSRGTRPAREVGCVCVSLWGRVGRVEASRWR